MKKALVFLLILGVAGGLFAQGFTLNGLVNAGIGMYKLDGEDDPVFGLIGKNQGANGIRAQINANYTNPDGNMGISMRFRTIGDQTAFILNWRWAFGWMTFMDGMIRAEGGRMQGNAFDTSDPIADGDTLFDAYGVRFFINPPGGMFRLGVGSYINRTLGYGVPLEQVHGWAGFGIYMPDMIDVVGQVRGAEHVGDFLLSARVRALPGIPINATFQFRDLPEFSDFGWMHFSQHVGYNLIDNVSINLALAQAMHNMEDTDMFFRAWFWVSYAMGNIVPRFDVNYVMGGTFTPNLGLNTNESLRDWDSYSTYTFDSDQTFLTVSPSVSFRVGGSSHLELGYIMGVDLGDVSAFGAKDGVHHAAFIDLRVAF